MHQLQYKALYKWLIIIKNMQVFYPYLTDKETRQKGRVASPGLYN